jgi:hypothetical protein
VFVSIAVHGTMTEIPDPSFASLVAGGTIELPSIPATHNSPRRVGGKVITRV